MTLCFATGTPEAGSNTDMPFLPSITTPSLLYPLSLFLPAPGITLVFFPSTFLCLPQSSTQSSSPSSKTPIPPHKLQKRTSSLPLQTLKSLDNLSRTNVRSQKRISRDTLFQAPDYSHLVFHYNPSPEQTLETNLSTLSPQQREN